MNVSQAHPAAGLALALTLAACASSAMHVPDAASPFVLGHPVTRSGIWTGDSQFLSAREVYTELRIEGASGTAASLRYGGPANCQISLEGAGGTDGSWRYDIAASSGGACDHALAGRLGVIASDGAVAITLVDSSGKRLGNGTLQAASVPR